MGIKRIALKTKNKIVETVKRRIERGKLKKEVKHAHVPEKLKSVQEEIARYKREADRYHHKILQIKRSYLQEDKEMWTLDRKGMLAEIKERTYSGRKGMEAVDPKARGERVPSRPTHPTLEQLNTKVYTKDKQPPIRDIKQYWNEDKKVKQLNIEIRPMIERARRVNAKIAKLEVMQSVLIAKEQLSGMQYERIQKAHMGLIDSLFSKYKSNKINELGLRDILQRINIEIEIMKEDGNSEKDISEHFNRIRRGVQEAPG